MAQSKSAKRAPRRHWPIGEKRRIVELTLRPGASVSAIAREHGVVRNSLYQWQVLYRAGKLDPDPSPSVAVSKGGATFLPVTVAPTPASLMPRASAAQRAARTNIVQLMLPAGATLRIETDELDAGVLCALLAQVQR